MISEIIARIRSRCIAKPATCIAVNPKIQSSRRITKRAINIVPPNISDAPRRKTEGTQEAQEAQENRSFLVPLVLLVFLPPTVQALIRLEFCFVNVDSVFTRIGPATLRSALRDATSFRSI